MIWSLLLNENEFHFELCSLKFHVFYHDFNCLWVMDVLSLDVSVETEINML